MTVSLVLFVLCIATLGALAALSWHAAWGEQRQGMRPNLVRPAALTGLLLLGLVTPLLAAPPGRPPAARPALTASVRARLAALRAGCAGSRADLDALERELAGEADVPAAGSDAPPPAAPPPPPAVPVWALVALAALLVAGGAVLLLGGDRSSLPFARWLRRLRGGGAAEAGGAEALTGAIHAARAGRFEDALAAAERVDAAALETFDRLDLLFVRAYAAFQVGLGAAAGARKEHFARAERDLEQLLRLAPEMGEALYLRATLRGLDGGHEAALTDFRAARPRLAGAGLPFDENESVCLIELAVGALEAAEADKAAGYLAEAESLKVLAAQVPLARVTFRLGEVQRAFRAGRMDDVRRLLQQTREMPGVGAELGARLALVCDVYEVFATCRVADPARAQEAVERFLAAREPAGLPPVDDDTADEFLEGAVARDRLPLPPMVYRALHFLLAVAQAKQLDAAARPMSEAAAKGLAAHLLRALQFSPRHRDALAGVGATYYWFIAGKRRKGREWIRAAVTLGVRSAVLRRLLDDDRRAEAERQGALEAFLGASMRFLTDATVRPTVRAALCEELGKFQEFQPLLLELGDRVAVEPRPVTLEVVRQRSDFVAGLLGEVGPRRTPALSAVGEEYRRAAESLTRSVAQIEELERKVFSELGRTLLE